MSAVLNRQFVIGLGETQEKVGKIVSAEGAIEGIGALCVAENILVLAIAHELAAEFEVVIALGPGQVVTELVVVSGVVPGLKRGVITHVVMLAKKYRRHAVLCVAAEENDGFRQSDGSTRYLRIEQGWRLPPKQFQRPAAAALRRLVFELVAARLRDTAEVEHLARHRRGQPEGEHPLDKCTAGDATTLHVGDQTTKRSLIHDALSSQWRGITRYPAREGAVLSS